MGGGRHKFNKLIYLSDGFFFHVSMATAVAIVNAITPLCLQCLFSCLSHFDSIQEVNFYKNVGTVISLKPSGPQTSKLVLFLVADPWNAQLVLKGPQ